MIGATASFDERQREASREEKYSEQRRGQRGTRWKAWRQKRKRVNERGSLAYL